MVLAPSRAATRASRVLDPGLVRSSLHPPAPRSVCSSGLVTNKDS